MQAVSCLEHKADKSNITEGANVALLTSSCQRRENKQLSNAWQDHQGRSLSNLQSKFGSCLRQTEKYQTHIAFPLLIKAKGINQLLAGSPIILLFSSE